MTPTKKEWIEALTLRHGEKLQKAFSSATVAVCGLGGLGSNIAVSLARVGIGKLLLIDFDRCIVNHTFDEFFTKFFSIFLRKIFFKS